MSVTKDTGKDQKDPAIRKEKITPKPKVKGWVSGTEFVESVIVDSRAGFWVKNTSTGRFTVERMIQTPEGPVKPLLRNEMGYTPFEFTSDEIKDYESVTYSREELLGDILEVVQQYVDVPLRDQILLTGDIFLTYCLEWTSTTHFLFFVGDSGSGKTNATQTAGELGYRCMMATSVSSANIYNFLGTDEEGCGCICEDEVEDIDSVKMRIYKNAYAKGRKIPKMDMLGRKKEQEYYSTYCILFFSGESLPDDKAFMQRTVTINMVKGKPKDNVKRPKYREWKEEHIPPLRKKLLLWKMQNIGKEFQTIDSGLTGREQELFEDFLSVFAGTKYESDAGDAIDYYVKMRHQEIKESLVAMVFSALRPHLVGQKEIEFLEIWEILTTNEEFSGELEQSGKTYVLHDGRRLTHNSVAKMLMEKFGAIKKLGHRSVDGKKMKITSYVFSEKTIGSLSEKYFVD